MSEQIYSPRVTTREIDQSFQAPITPDRTAVVVGPTQKGNYFKPTLVNLSNIDAKIGLSSQNNLKEYTSLTAEQFLRGGADNVWVIPVTNTQDYDLGNSHTIMASVGGTSYPIAVLFLTESGSGATLSVTGDANNLTISAGSVDYSGIDITTESGLRRFYDRFRNPKSNSREFYVKYIFSGNVSATIDSVSLDTSGSAIDMNGFRKGVSPWVLSQNFGSNASPNFERLFRFKMLQSSASANRDITVRISDIETAEEVNSLDPSYGRFQVSVYKYKSKNVIKDESRTSSDTEQLLESFVCDLNPQSNDYIERVIGNREEYYDVSSGQMVQKGIYSNRSQYISVEISNLDVVPSTAIPWGFERYDQVDDIYGGEYPAYYRNPTANTDGGIDFDDWYVDFLHTELPQTVDASKSPDEAYLLKEENESNLQTDPSTLDFSLRSFRFGFFGGTMGRPDTQNSALGESISESNVVGFDITDSDADGYADYKRALDILRDAEDVQFNMLFIPAVNAQDHPSILNYAINMLESKGSAILFMDAGNPVTTENQLIQDISTSFDSSYVASFDPWLLSDRNVLIPPTVAVARSIAINDRNFQPWYSLIGFERGLIYGVSDVVRKYNQPSKDNLVRNRINPIAKYLNEIGIFGQETMLQADTLLRRYPIRRLLIEAKFFISDIAKNYIGKQLTDQVITNLENEINTYLDELLAQRGIRYGEVQFERDREDLINRGIVSGRIVLQPRTAIKGIQLTFVISNQGVEFD